MSTTPASVRQAPRPAHVAVPAFAPAVEVLDARVAQPPAGVRHSAAADVDPLTASADGICAVAVPAVSRAMQAVPVAHAVDAVLRAVARLPADMSVFPVSRPVQPTSQIRVELLCPSARNAGAVRVPARVVAATVSLVTAHPVAAAAQVAVVRERAVRPI